MKKQIQVLAILLFVMGFAFAHDKKISCNGITVPDWMMNCIVLESERAFGSAKCIGDLLGTPNEETKIKRVSVDGKKLHLEYYVGEKASESVYDVIFDFVCAKMGDSGTTYVSYVKFVSRLTFEEWQASCKGLSDEYGYGKCLGMMKRIAELMFVDEERIAREKAENEERIAKEREENELRRAAAFARDYKYELESALNSGEVGFGFSLDSFKYKGKLVVDKVDETMSKLGFLKGDIVAEVRGFPGASEVFMLAVRGSSSAKSSIASALSRENVTELVFVVTRKGKPNALVVPVYNQNQLEAFREKFNKEWEEKNPIENFIK